MFDLFVNICQTYPQIAIFLAIAIGYYVGKIKIYGFTLGSTAGVLLAALVIGQMNIKVDELLQAVGFALFIFAIGYKVGPSFFGALRKDGLNYIWVSLVVAVSGLVTALILGKIFNFDPGTTAGLLAGAMTQSTVIGTADGAIMGLPISAAQRAALQSNVAVAYAITYIFGVAGLIVFFRIIPKILGFNLKKDAQEMEAKMSGGEEPDSTEHFSWYKMVNVRAFDVTNQHLLGKTVKQVEALFPGRVAIERIKRGSQLIGYNPETTLQPGDKIAIAGGYKGIVAAKDIIGQEIDDKTLINMIGEFVSVCVLNPKIVGKTLGELGQIIGHGCFLRGISRQGNNLPLLRDTVIHKCDILVLMGIRDEIEDYIKYLGYVERPTSATDLIMVGFGIVLGSLIGLISVTILGIPLTLGVGGGVLVSGLVFGWLRAVHPTFGQIPDGAQWIFDDLGLNLFIACVGLTAGPQAVHALRTSGGAVFFAGAILSVVPMLVGIVYGRVILKMNPILLFGALAGAGTATPSLNAIKDEADSSTPALGFAIPYAFGNVILTIWGTVIVHVMQSFR